MTNLKTKIMWIDGLGALGVGTLMLLLSFWLSELYSLPETLILGLGVMNIIYGLYSTTLAIKIHSAKALINLLIIANLFWALICFGLAFYFIKVASLFGLAQLFGEGIYVAGLAYFEWRWREMLVKMH